MLTCTNKSKHYLIEKNILLGRNQTFICHSMLNLSEFSLRAVISSGEPLTILSNSAKNLDIKAVGTAPGGAAGS